MKRVVPCLTLALLAGCASVAPPPPAQDETMDELSAGEKAMHWLPNLFLDFYDIFEANLGTGKDDYELGAHAQFTKLFRLGVFDMADFELFGLNHALHSESDFLRFDQGQGEYDVALKLGMGAGARAGIDLYEVYDWLAGVVTFNQVNPSADHQDWRAGT